MHIPFFSYVLLGIICLIFIKYKIKRIFIELLILSILFELTVNMGFFIKIENIEVPYYHFLLFLTACCGCILILEKKFDKCIFLYGISLILVVVLGLIFFYLFPFKGKIIATLYGWDYFFILYSNNTLGLIESNPDLVLGLRGDDLFRADVGLTNFVDIFKLIRWIIILSVSKYIICQNNHGHDKTFFYICNKISSLSVILLVYGVFEVLFKFFGDINLSFWSINFLGERVGQFSGNDLRGNLPSVIGLFTETSVYAYRLFLLLLFYLILINFYHKNGPNRNIYLFKKNMERFCVCLFLFFMTRSFFCVVAFPLILFFFFYIKKVNSVISFSRLFFFLQLILLSFIVAFVFYCITYLFFGNFFQYFSSRIERVIEYYDYLPTIESDYALYWSSETARLTSIKESIRILFRNIFFGVGLGNSDCHSTIVSFALNVGIFGFVLWLLIIRKFCSKFGCCSVIIFIPMFIEGSKSHVFDISYCLIIFCYSMLVYSKRCLLIMNRKR